MEQRRLLVFSLSVLLIWGGWFIVGPKLFPGLFPAPPDHVAVDEGAEGQPPVAQVGGQAPVAALVRDPQAAAGPAHVLPAHPAQTVTLGSTDPRSAYCMTVDLTSVGAAVRNVTLNDPRYPVAERQPVVAAQPPQLRVVGNHLPLDAPVTALSAARPPLTLDLQVDSVDRVFRAIDPQASLRTLHWELVETSQDDNGVPNRAVFSLKSADGQLEFRKTFFLKRLDAKRLTEAHIRDLSPDGYQLDVAFEVRNLSPQAATLEYVLQGPVGLPLERAETARKYRDIKAGFQSGRDVSAKTLTAVEVVKAEENNKVEEWSQPVKYVGVDVQYFAAILVPGENQAENQWFKFTRPMVVETAENKSWSDISVTLHSEPLEIPAQGAVMHSFGLFAGPKRRELLEPYQADQMIDYGWFASISHVMVWLVSLFHDWGAPYGLAITMLTVVVRGLMFPISRKQALSGKKMKEMQPELMALKEKYGEDRQKLAQAQMELYRRTGANPLAGCLPLFIQLPIFIALYQALSNWVDLRMAPLLWVTDLSAPDELFEMPFDLPFLGRWFNLLPLVTMALFFIQQKMVMPPPMNEEMALQQKMMNIMTFVFGFMFYHVPAGLCVYFIASSAWGMTERQILERLPEPPKTEARPGLLARLLGPKFKETMRKLQEAAEMQQQAQREQENRRKRD